MGKFYGEIGYAETVETSPGVWEPTFTIRKYYGDVLKNIIENRDGENLNDELNIKNRISIIGDPFAYDHIGHIRYVVWMGSMWKVTSVDLQHPRIILNIGGVFNE